MKRWLLIGVVLAFCASLLGVSVRADVNDFRITDYQIEYRLSRDDEQRSILHTTETITALFPSSDQNHGIERAIPKSYDGHPTKLSVQSVTDESGKALQHSERSSGDNLILRIGDAETYVHGPQRYVITYTQRDVTRYFADVDSDEFYWDTNGTGWKVPIDHLSVSLRMDEVLVDARTDDTSCYIGDYGQSDRCQVVGESGSLQVEASDLAARQNITLAVGFEPGTFASYQPSTFDRVMQVLSKVLPVMWAMAVGVVVWLGVKYVGLSNRRRELGTIVAEYLPPKGQSVMAAASILSLSTRAFPAQLIDFAVRHYVKVYEIKKKGLFGGTDYEIEIVKDIKSLKHEEQEILRDIFSGNVAVGSRLKLSTLRSNTAVYKSTLNNHKQLTELIRGEYGLRERDALKSGWLKRVGWLLLPLSIVLLNPVLLVASLMAFVMAQTLWPLTDKGLALTRHLAGLKRYIKVAETERLKMLQSADGAQKVGAVDIDDPKKLVKLYERVLPYAVLFGQESSWNKQLGQYYESTNSSPVWYQGSSAFNAAAFGVAMTNFSTQVSYSAPSSSSSGGSSGGGFSGGGGGGGGGGGW